MAEDRIRQVTFNMTSMQRFEQLTKTLDAVRNLKVEDKVPLLFLDEFDAHESNYGFLLPLLWDGELNIDDRQLQVGKVVIIMAGSGAAIAAAIRAAKGIQNCDIPAGKLRDLLSRINGGELTIPPLDEVTPPTRDRRVDKVCLTLSLLEQRFGKQLEAVPWAFLRFISSTKFRYGGRSVAHLVDMLRPVQRKPVQLNFEDLRLPLDSTAEYKTSSLIYHVVSDDGPSAIVERWKQIKECQRLVIFKSKYAQLLTQLAAARATATDDGQ